MTSVTTLPLKEELGPALRGSGSCKAYPIPIQRQKHVLFPQKACNRSKQNSTTLSRGPKAVSPPVPQLATYSLGCQVAAK